MPTAIDKMKVPRDKDRRVKLTDAQREEIKEAYGTISQRKLARMYGVSRRLVQFIGDPAKHKRNLECRAERGGSMQYYNKEKWRAVMREHREYKRRIRDGEI